jgi:hypothetical protein
MELRQLTALIAIAETGSITRAADRLRVVQPAVTRQLQALEREANDCTSSLPRLTPSTPHSQRRCTSSRAARSSCRPLATGCVPSSTQPWPPLTSSSTWSPRPTACGSRRNSCPPDTALSRASAGRQPGRSHRGCHQSIDRPPCRRDDPGPSRSTGRGPRTQAIAARNDSRCRFTTSGWSIGATCAAFATTLRRAPLTASRSPAAVATGVVSS